MPRAYPGAKALLAISRLRSNSAIEDLQSVTLSTCRELQVTRPISHSTAGTLAREVSFMKRNTMNKGRVESPARSVKNHVLLLVTSSIPKFG